MQVSITFDAGRQLVDSVNLASQHLTVESKKKNGILPADQVSNVDVQRKTRKRRNRDPPSGLLPRHRFRTHVRARRNSAIQQSRPPVLLLRQIVLKITLQILYNYAVKQKIDSFYYVVLASVVEA
jgi:hypothetical protein